MLAVLPLVVVGTLFHELGHAAALRYGGGRPGNIGVGIFLVYPVFYTEVTDNYRLPRLDRVRTDLGGIYFTQIFVTALVAAYVLTGHVALLLAVALLNLQTVYNLIPFVRFDGYWAAADITGVPDFFTYAGPFVRSHLPARFAGERAMPDLKPWARRFFAAWLLVSVPLPAMVLYQVLAIFPEAVEAAADSLARQRAALAVALGNGDALLLAATLLRVAALALPVAGMAYILVRLGSGAARWLWAWSRPTPLRRAAGGLAGAVTILALLSLWAPQLPLTDGRSGPLYRRMRAGLAGAAPTASATPTPDMGHGPANGPRPVP
jgi:putative peptide zinc metalloprotease protein